MPRRPRPSARLAGAAAALGLAAAATGCGGADASGPVNPARAVPPEAAVYVGVVLRPRGDTAAAADRLAGSLLGRAPARSLARAAGEAFVPRGQPLRWARDVRPWLGPRAALFLLPRPGAEPPARGIVAIADDPQAAAAAVARAADGLATRSERGLPFRTDGRRALAAVRGFVVAGDAEAVRASLRALASGLSLGASDRFSRAVPPGGPRRLAVLYAEPARAAQLLAGAGLAPASAAALQAGLAARGAAPLVAAVSARPGGLAIDAGPRPASAERADGAPGAGPPAPSPLLAGLPANAAAAAGSPGPLGAALAAALDPSALPGLRVPALAAATARLRRAGLDPARAARAVGAAGIALGLPGGAVILAEAARPAALAGSLRLAARALGLAPPIIAVAGRRVAAGTSAASVRAVLAPARPLGSLPAYRQARRALGSRLAPFAFAAPAALRALAGPGAPPLARRAVRGMTAALAGAGAGVLRLALAVRPVARDTRPPSP